MSNLLRAIAIDPYTRDVYETEIPSGLDSIYAQLTKDDVRFSGTIDAVNLETERGLESIFLDDEGMLVPGRACWTFGTKPHAVYAGSGLILGLSVEGESVSTRLSLMQVRDAVHFLDEESSGTLGAPSEGIVDHPHFGPTHTFIGGSPILQPRGTWAASQAAAVDTEDSDNG